MSAAHSATSSPAMPLSSYLLSSPASTTGSLGIGMSIGNGNGNGIHGIAMSPSTAFVSHSNSAFSAVSPSSNASSASSVALSLSPSPAPFSANFSDPKSISRYRQLSQPMSANQPQLISAFTPPTQHRPMIIQDQRAFVSPAAPLSLFAHSPPMTLTTIPIQYATPMPAVSPLTHMSTLPRQITLAHSASADASTAVPATAPSITALHFAAAYNLQQLACNNGYTTIAPNTTQLPMPPQLQSQSQSQPLPSVVTAAAATVPSRRRRAVGSSCHQCKTRRVNDELVYCKYAHRKKGRMRKKPIGVSINADAASPSTSAIDKRLCLKKFCGACVARGGFVSLPSGISIPIEEMIDVRTNVSTLSSAPIGYDESEDFDRRRHCVSSAQQTAHFDNGIRHCIEIVMSDGRTLVCTADHQVSVIERGRLRWSRADSLTTEMRLAVAITHPKVNMINAQTTWKQKIGTRTLQIDTFDHALYAMAFARLSGLLKAQFGRAHEQHSFVVDHTADAQCVLNDIVIVTGDISRTNVARMPSKPIRKYQIQITEELWRELHESDSDDATVVPEWIMQDAAPLLIRREFIAAVFGSTATSIEWNSTTAATRPPLLTMQTADAAAAMAKLIAHTFNVQYSLADTTIQINADSALQYEQEIGYRYAIRKSLQSTSAAIQARIYDTIGADDIIDDEEIELSDTDDHDDNGTVNVAALMSARCRIPILHVRPLSIRPCGLLPVYDLFVDETHNYFVSDCAVHNCLSKFYLETAPEVTGPNGRAWTCPACRGICSCAACKRNTTKRESKRKTQSTSNATQTVAQTALPISFS